jgi:hypothetical protein
MMVVPLRLADYLPWCVAGSHDPGSSEARAEYAVEQVRVSDDVIPWPPGAGEACWCGSARGYADCCGT